MAIRVQTTDLHVTAGHAITLAQGDELYIAPRVNVTTTAAVSAAVFSNTGVSVEVQGSLFGFRGIWVGAANQLSLVTIGREASVSGTSGREAVFVLGSHRIVNNGEISINGGAGYGIYTQGGSGDVRNTGLISASSGIVRAGNGVETISGFNSGTISGQAYSYFASFVLSDSLVNTGVMIGEVQLGGTTSGFFDSRLGQVYGTIRGGNGTDTIYAGTNGGTVEGLGGDDVIGGSTGVDVLDGGSGTDTVSYITAARGMIVDLAAQAADDGDRLISMENVIGSQFADTVFGSEGDNVMEGGLGADKLYGFGGDDTVSYAGSTSAMIIDLASQAANDGDTFISVENAIGSAFGDIVFGSEGSNRIQGLAGADRLNGFGGNDVLLGGDGNDILDGGLGRDRIDGGAGSDTASFLSATGGVIVDLAVQATNQGDLLVSIENMIGSSFDDTVFGSDGDNVMEGGLGADKLYGYGGFDTVSYANYNRGVSVNLATQTADDGDTFIGVEAVRGSAFADVLTGSNSQDTLYGGGGGDQLMGGGGNDVLIGEAGADVLTGGAGADTFVFDFLADSAVGAPDLITDFTPGSGDLVSLANIDANRLISGNQAFVIAPAFTFEAGQAVFSYNAGSNTTTVALDVNGDADADFILLLTGDASSGLGFIL